MSVKNSLGSISQAANVARKLYRESIAEYGRGVARQIVLEVLRGLGYGRHGINR